jgi:RNA polymerase sigma factor (sigma-70 family)
LHAEDLALACACSAGHEQAWEHFIRSFRPQLYAAARAIAGESSARELADSLYAELYGLAEKDSQRRSLFDYFHGRSKLSTWMRAILAQRYVDSIRAHRREESLDARESDSDESRRAIPELAAVVAEPDPDRSRFLDLLQHCIADSLAALDSRDRLRLAYYYVQDLTLAQIGRLLGEHEATVSRKLDRTRRDLRRQVERALREVQQLSEAQIHLCYQYAQGEWPFDLTAVLAGEKHIPTKQPGGEGET